MIICMDWIFVKGKHTLRFSFCVVSVRNTNAYINKSNKYNKRKKFNILHSYYLIINNNCRCDI